MSQPKIFIITGCAQGMGKEMLLQLVSKGEAVIGIDWNETALKALQNEIKQDAFLLLQTCNVADSEQVQQWFRDIESQLNGKEIVLINNAGVSLISGSFNDTDLHEFNRVMEINFNAVVRIVKLFLPILLRHNSGCICAVSSIFGLGGVEGNSAYCASKFALRGFMESLRMELMPTQIRTLIVHPGGIKTNIVRNGFSKTDTESLNFKNNTALLFDEKARTSAMQAATQILCAIENRKERLIIGIDGKLFAIATRIFPVLYTKIVKKRIEQTFGKII